MGLFNWVMKGIGFESDEEDEDFDVSGANRKLTRKEKRALKKAKKNKKGYNDDFNVITDANMPLPNSFAMNRDQFNTSNSGFGQTGSVSTYGAYGSYNQKNFVFFTPKNYEDVKKLIEYLKQTEPAIVNLDNITDDEAQRILDFISGGVCALNGSIQRIKGNIFLVAPDGFNIMMQTDKVVAQD